MCESEYKKFKFLSGKYYIKDNKLYHKSGPLVDREIACKASNKRGYCQVNVNKNLRMYYHTIIWILANGDIEDGLMIDHKDGNPLNNDITNLRLVTSRGNNQNGAAHRDGKIPCVKERITKSGEIKYCPRISLGEDEIALGTYNSLEDAIGIRDEAIKLISENNLTKEELREGLGLPPTRKITKCGNVPCILGHNRSLKDWCSILNLTYGTIKMRLSKYKWSVWRALEVDTHPYFKENPVPIEYNTDLHE